MTESAEMHSAKSAKKVKEVIGYYILVSSVVNAVLLMPSVIITLCNWVGWDTYDVYWSGIWPLCALPVTFLAIFFVPELLFVVGVIGSLVLIILGLREKKKHFRAEHWALLFNVICTMGLVSLEEVFWVMMSV